MVFIYVLKLENDKYYVGKTSNPEFRLNRHFKNNGSNWTKLYKPIEIIKLINDCDDYDEDKYTIIYMNNYGIDNVRGGSYTTINLSKSTKKHLIKMTNTANNRCFNCSGIGHFAKNCYLNKDDSDSYESYDFDSDDIVWSCRYCNKEFEDENDCDYHEKKCRKNDL